MHSDQTSADLLRRYMLREIEVPLPRQNLRLLAASASEELVDVEGGDAELPYWSEVWEAGIALAAFLQEGPPAAGMALELGAGVGVVGLGLALGGTSVLMTDGSLAAVRAARANARLNGLEDRVRIVAADWRAWPVRQRFRLAVGSEITYRSELHGPLLKALTRSMLPGGAVFLADRGRASGDRFARRLLAAGWSVSEYPLPIPGRAAGSGRLLRALAP